MSWMDWTLFGGSLEILFFVACLLAAGLCAFLVVRGVTAWRRDNGAPRLTVAAGVVRLRRGRSWIAARGHYATFRVESGDEFELCVPCRDFFRMEKGDSGRLTFQGKRYLSFERA